MSCPHSSALGSSPETCSQCLMAKARVVAYDPQLDMLTIDGKPHDRERIPGNSASTTTAQRNRMGRRGGIRNCSNCGKPGHNRAKCGRDEDFN